jgi:hypothetical protein
VVVDWMYIFCHLISIQLLGYVHGERRRKEGVAKVNKANNKRRKKWAWFSSL